MTTPRKTRDPKTLRAATQLVHGGSMRSSFEETSEALFLTQGYLYDTMEQAEARFKGEAPGFIYSRFANPTVAMFERRMALLEGAESARATASGMAAVTAALMGQLRAGDHIVAAQGPVRLLSLCRRGAAAALRRRRDAGRRRGSRPVARRDAPEHQDDVSQSSTNLTLEVVDIAGVAETCKNMPTTPLVARCLCDGCCSAASARCLALIVLSIPRPSRSRPGRGGCSAG